MQSYESHYRSEHLHTRIEAALRRRVVKRCRAKDLKSYQSSEINLIFYGAETLTIPAIVQSSAALSRLDYCRN